MAPLKGKKRALKKGKEEPSPKVAPPLPKAKPAPKKSVAASSGKKNATRAEPEKTARKSKRKAPPSPEPESESDDEEDLEEEDVDEAEGMDSETEAYMEDLMQLKEQWTGKDGEDDDEEDGEDDDEEDGEDDEEDVVEDETTNNGEIYTHTEAPTSKKKDIFSSFDDDDEVQDDEFDGEDDEDMDEDGDSEDDAAILRKMTLEERAALLDQLDDDERAAAAAEMERMVRDEQSVYNLTEEGDNDEADDGEGGMQVVEDLDVTMGRINDVIEVLSFFKERREPGRSRADYTDQLARDLATYFEYLPELIDLWMKIFSPKEILEFLEANEKQRPVVIRTNTLKTRRKDLAKALVQRGVTLEPLAPWSKVGIKITEAKIPIGATPEYLAGHYILQAASSMCSVLALAPQEKERVLDMASAPGGKTSYVAQLMKNTGCVVANDLKRGRLKATVYIFKPPFVVSVVACCKWKRK